jgi:hypothetical protein
MYFYFADDTRHRKPTRPGMGPLAGIGGIAVPADSVRELERSIAALCDEFGLPAGQEFKWSPGRELWMWDNLKGPKRRCFFLRIVKTLEDGDATALAVLSDASVRPATGAARPEEDVATMFLERVNYHAQKNGSQGVVIVARPSGTRKSEGEFLHKCLETLEAGTPYCNFEQVALPVLCAHSGLIRLMQCADVVVGCCGAMVSGEAKHAPAVFSVIQAILGRDGGRVGGVGLKIHPDLKYANLYHWLLGDSHWWKGGSGLPLPRKGLPYFHGPLDDRRE